MILGKIWRYGDLEMEGDGGRWRLDHVETGMDGVGG